MKIFTKIIFHLIFLCSFLNAQNKLNPKGIDIPLDLPATYNPDKRCISVKKLSYYVQMRDSVMIAVDVYLPKNIEKGEKLPVILHQTRYWRSVGFIWPIKTFKHMVLSGEHYNVLEFAKQGYALVVADVRGTGASTGIKTTGSPDIKEVLDGKELVDWILKQPWSNGKIGATGISYIGTTAEMLLINRNPAVKAVAPMYAGFDLYDDIARPGGIYYSRFLKSWNEFNKALDSNKLPDFKKTFLSKLLVTGVSIPKKGRKTFNNFVSMFSFSHFNIILNVKLIEILNNSIFLLLFKK